MESINCITFNSCSNFVPLFNILVFLRNVMALQMLSPFVRASNLSVLKKRRILEAPPGHLLDNDLRC